MTPLPPEVEPSAWDVVVRLLAHPVRLIAWIVALAVFVGPLGGGSWVVVGALASMVGVGLGELAGRSRVRLPLLLAGALGLSALAWLTVRVLTAWTLGPTVFGPAGTVWITSLLAVAATVGIGLGTLRTLAVRGPAYGAVELFGLGGLLASAVASHRDGAVARPLWLSDLAWSFGVDPGRVLLIAGAGLTALLAALLLLGSERRKPGFGLIVLPALALVGWLVATRLPPLDPPDPEDFLGLGDGEREGQQVTDGGEVVLDGTPEDGQQPEDGGKPEDGGQPKDGGNPEDGGQPQDGGTPEDGRQPQDGQDPKDGGRPDDTRPPQDQPQDGGDPPTAPDPLNGGGSGGKDTPVAVVLIDDDFVPPTGVWYLRQGQLSVFNGTRLVESTNPAPNADLFDHFPVAPEDTSWVAPLNGPDGAPVRTPVHGTVALLVDHPQPFAPEAVARIEPLGNPFPERFIRRYGFVSHGQTVDFGALIGRPLGDPAWSPETRAELLALPDDPRYRALADEIVAELATQRPELADDPFARSVGVVLWIGENMKYSKKERHAGVDDPTASFLFGNRIGYCTHSAHAAVYLWRSLGYPSRVATGYAVEDANRRGSALIVYGSFAHAWPELYVEGIGWVPLDIAPAENLDPPGVPPDEDETQTLGEMARAHAPDLEQIGPRADYSWIWGWVGYTVSRVLGTLVLTVLFAYWTVKAWRRARPLWAGSRALSRVGYRAALDLLAEAGHVREPGETREAFARRLHALPALTHLTDLHLRGALGRVADADPERSRAEWTGWLLRLRHELRQSTPWWRRAIGLIDPTSVHRAR